MLRTLEKNCTKVKNWNIAEISKRLCSELVFDFIQVILKLLQNCIKYYILVIRLNVSWPLLRKVPAENSIQWKLSKFRKVNANYKTWYTLKPMFNDNLWDPKNSGHCWQVVVVIGGHLCNKSPNMDLKMVDVINRWSLAQVWL